jgi:hypothetical protein
MVNYECLDLRFLHLHTLLNWSASECMVWLVGNKSKTLLNLLNVPSEQYVLFMFFFPEATRVNCGSAREDWSLAANKPTICTILRASYPWSCSLITFSEALHIRNTTKCIQSRHWNVDKNSVFEKLICFRNLWRITPRHSHIFNIQYLIFGIWKWHGCVMWWYTPLAHYLRIILPRKPF